MGIQISLPMMAFLVFMTGFAGFIDSAAGGGGLISLPAYLFAGLPPHYTYATNKFSAACGTTFATASFFKNGAMNIKVGILAAIGSFAGSALGAHIVLMLSDEVLQMMMFIILPIAAVIILWRRNLPDENRDDGTLNLKKTLLALGIGFGIGLYDGMVGPGTGTFAIIAFTSLMGFDLRTDVGYYNVGGVLTDRSNRLESLEGEYIPGTKDANFYVDVHLNSLSEKDTLDIYTDSLFYNTDSHIAELYSPSRVINARGTIYTDNAYYDTDADTCALYDRSVVTTPEGRFVVADTIYYRRPEGTSRCLGDMLLEDSVRRVQLRADYGFFNQTTDSAYATGRLLIKEYSQGDTLYLHGRQLNAYRLLDTIVTPGVEADTVAGTPAIPETSRIDTTHVADIWPRVRFYRSDMQGICDSLRVTQADSTVRLYVSPVVWSGERQIHGNIIELHLNDSIIDRARLPEHAFTSERVADDFYNQMSGKEMIAYFEGGHLRQLDINGNVELMMYPEEKDSTINKMVRAESSFLQAFFDGNTTERIKMWPETTGTATPLFLVRRSMLFLPKFKLFKGVRPLSPADVFVIPDEMERIMSEAARPGIPAKTE